MFEILIIGLCSAVGATIMILGTIFFLNGITTMTLTKANNEPDTDEDPGTTSANRYLAEGVMGWHFQGP